MYLSNDLSKDEQEEKKNLYVVSLKLKHLRHKVQRKNKGLIVDDIFYNLEQAKTLLPPTSSAESNTASAPANTPPPVHFQNFSPLLKTTDRTPIFSAAPSSRQNANMKQNFRNKKRANPDDSTPRKKNRTAVPMYFGPNIDSYFPAENQTLNQPEVTLPEAALPEVILPPDDPETTRSDVNSDFLNGTPPQQQTE